MQLLSPVLLASIGLPQFLNHNLDFVLECVLCGKGLLLYASPIMVCPCL